MPGSIVSATELARTFEREISGRPIARRRWAVNLSDDTLTAATPGPPSTQSLIEECIPGSWSSWNQAHPDLSFLKLRKVTLNERFEDDPYKVEVIAEYGLLTAEELLHPTSRAAVWSFESKPAEVPALFYYHGTTPGAVGEGNATKRPLTNSAYDFFPGLSTEESLVSIKIKRNFLTLGATNGPTTWIAAQGFLNNATYFNCAAHTLKVASVEAVFTSSEFAGQLVSYYETTATLLYRQSTHNLLLPDVGFNFIDGNEKRRAMVFDWKNNEWVATPNPVGLDGNGGQTLNAPSILTRRVSPETSFLIFGTPPS